MISRDSVITVNGNKATIDSDIYLYKYDKNIQLAFTIINSKYMYDNDDSNNLIKNMQAAYAQVKFKKDDSDDIEIEFEIQATRRGAVLLTINGELTDEDTELGEYSIQIRLLDSNKNSVVTLPPVESCIHILAPLFEKLGADTNVVNKAVVNKAVARYAAPLSATTEDGTFNSKTWVDKEHITTAELNRIEKGIKTNSTNIKENQINLIEDDTSMEGISDSEHDTLTTNDKTIIGGINELNTQYKDIAKQTITEEERNKLTNLNNYDDTSVKTKIQNVQQQVNNLVLGAVGDGNNAEVVQARGIYNTLNDRVSNKLDISNIRKLKVSDIPKTEGSRINWTNGNLLSISGWSYINLDVSNTKYMIITTKNLGSSDLGCAFYDAENTYLSGIRTGNATDAKLAIPAKACYFKYGLSNNDWETYKDNYITLCDNTSNFNDLNKTITMLEENDKENQPELGVMDNKLPYIWYNYGKLYSLNNAVEYSNSIEKNSLYVTGDYDTQSGMIYPSFTSYFTLKKSDSIMYYSIRNQSGVECRFNDATISSGDVICQTNTTNKMVNVIAADDEKIVISIIETVKGYKIKAFSDKDFTIPTELKIDIDKSAVFYSVYDKNSINYNYKYLSRAEKLNSKIIGKNLFIFSDSQSSFIKILAQDYGANIFHITNGGCRMGYTKDTGLGGETGTADNLWLCNSTRVNNFNNLFLNNNELKIDYIINFTGGNGPFENIGTADELKYILSHKKWFGDNSQDDPFDTLSNDDKLRFTSPLCYLASFITINKVFPRAIPVVCDLYNYVGGSYRFTNETWENLNDLVDIMYDENAAGKKKSLLLHDLAKMIGAIVVKASECGYAYTNIGYYGSDRVHGNFQSATNLAHLIAKHTSFVPRIEEQYPKDK